MLNDNTGRKLTGASEANVLQQVFFQTIIHSHASVRLFYTKGNGMLAAVKNQSRKFPFRYVLFQANIL